MTSVGASADPANLNALSFEVIGAAIEVHDHLGSGLLERAYQEALRWELIDQGYQVHQEVAVQATYKGRPLDAAYRIDLVVEGQIALELKAVEEIHPAHEAQLLTYLEASGLPLGLLINFHAARILDELRRFVN